MSLVVPLILSLGLSFHGLRKGSLSPSGSLAAFLVGFGTLNAPIHVFGVALLIFYLTGSRATKPMFAPNSWHASLISLLTHGDMGVTYDGSWCPTDVRVAGGWIVVISPPRYSVAHAPYPYYTLRRVPPGTNGAISALGTFAAILGGAIIGTAMSVWLWMGVVWELTAWGICAGLGGSLIDSILGATIQRTRYSDTRKLILQDG
ncbi:integral membrane protein DUF92-domain-containing protein [Infundibulicybe gibba]|nr:integral membrane protein DUF92-domain-containing protein [Infundibulicybe gibba]